MLFFYKKYFLSGYKVGGDFQFQISKSISPFQFSPIKSGPSGGRRTWRWANKWKVKSAPKRHQDSCLIIWATGWVRPVWTLDVVPKSASYLRWEDHSWTPLN